MPNERKEAQFFDEHVPTNPVINAARLFVKCQDARHHFVNNLVKKIGFPYWDKSIVIKGPAPVAARTASDSADIVFIPFVQENSIRVDAGLRISIYPQDTTFQLICNWQYADSVSAGMDPKGQTLLLMSLDRSVFGHQLFRITDSTAFPMDSGRAAYVRLTSDIYTGNTTPGGRTELVTSTYLTVCNEVQVPNSGDLTGCAPGEPCNGYHTVNQCTTWVVYDVVEDGGSSTGSGTGGSTGNSGGSGGSGSAPEDWDPPPCTGANCSGGWVPVTDDPFQQGKIDSLLKRSALVCNRFRDSLATLCESEHKERFFNIVSYNNQNDTFRVLIGQSDDEVKPNYYMTGGRILIGSWHYHPKYSDGTPGSWPSGGDVAQLYDKQEGFVMIIDADNARYALVVENFAKMTAWKNIYGNGPNMFPEKVALSVLSDTRLYTTGSTYIDMTKEKLLAALGSSGICGIGLYKASAVKGTIFTKIN